MFICRYFMLGNYKIVVDVKNLVSNEFIEIVVSVVKIVMFLFIKVMIYVDILLIVFFLFVLGDIFFVEFLIILEV